MIERVNCATCVGEVKARCDKSFEIRSRQISEAVTLFAGNATFEHYGYDVKPDGTLELKEYEKFGAGSGPVMDAAAEKHSEICAQLIDEQRRIGCLLDDEIIKKQLIEGTQV